MYSNTDLQGGALYTPSKWQDRAPFFTKFPDHDVRGQAASKFALPQDSAVPISEVNTDEYSDIIIYKNYDSQYRPSVAQDKDVSHEWIEFIVDTAKWHRSIDNRTDASFLKIDLEGSVNLLFNVMKNPGEVQTLVTSSGRTKGRFAPNSTNANTAKDSLSILHGVYGIDRLKSGLLLKKVAGHAYLNVGNDGNVLDLQGDPTQARFDYGLGNNWSSSLGADNTPFENVNDTQAVIDTDQHTSQFHGVLAYYVLGCIQMSKTNYESVRRGGVVGPGPAASIDAQLNRYWDLVHASNVKAQFFDPVFNKTYTKAGGALNQNRGFLYALYDMEIIPNANMTAAEAAKGYFRPKLESNVDHNVGPFPGSGITLTPAPSEEYLTAGLGLTGEKVNKLPVSIRYVIHTLLQEAGRTDFATMDQQFINGLYNVVTDEFKKEFIRFMKAVFITISY